MTRAFRMSPPVAARWRRNADVVVVGSGAAGISAALTAAAAGLRVLMVTKDLIGGATPLAQGGLAAAIGPGDSAASHVSDTLTAGAGLCEPDVVASLAAAAPGVIDWLAGLGARLDTRELRLEGGHSHHRIVHSGDDASGAEVHRTLLAALLASGIEILDRTVALDLIVENPAAGDAADRGRTGTGAGRQAADGTAAANADPVDAPVRTPVPAGRVAGLTVGVIGSDGRLSAGVIDAPAVVIAAGGLGQAFATTSNPAGATGDGIAIAARAGAALAAAAPRVARAPVPVPAPSFSPGSLARAALVVAPRPVNRVALLVAPGPAARVAGPLVPVARRDPSASPASLSSKSSATVRSRISIPLASSAASSVRCTSAPVASSPE